MDEKIYTHTRAKVGGEWGVCPSSRRLMGTGVFFSFSFFSFSFTICSSNQSCRFPFSVKSMTLVESQLSVSHHKPSFASHVLPGPRSPPPCNCSELQLSNALAPLPAPLGLPPDPVSPLCSHYTSRTSWPNVRNPLENQGSFLSTTYVGTIHIVTKSLSYTYVKEYTIYT